MLRRIPSLRSGGYLRGLHEEVPWFVVFLLRTSLPPRSTLTRLPFPFTAKVESLTLGDPFHEDTFQGPQISQVRPCSSFSTIRKLERLGADLPALLFLSSSPGSVRPNHGTHRVRKEGGSHSSYRWKATRNRGILHRARELIRADPSLFRFCFDADLLPFSFRPSSPTSTPSTPSSRRRSSDPSLSSPSSRTRRRSSLSLTRPSTVSLLLVSRSLLPLSSRPLKLTSFPSLPLSQSSLETSLEPSESPTRSTPEPFGSTATVSLIYPPSSRSSSFR